MPVERWAVAVVDRRFSRWEKDEAAPVLKLHIAGEIA
jgi:hypothetical protein